MTATSTDTRRRLRPNCIVQGCSNQAYARQLCCRHGAKKTCSVEGCDLRARSNGICFAHGAPKRQCNEPGCDHPAQARKKCVKHGGGRRCNAPGCIAHARCKGKCQRHAAIDTPLDMMAFWGVPDKVHHKRSYSVDSSDDVATLDLPPVQIFDDSNMQYTQDHSQTCGDVMMMEVYSLLLNM
ncbi:unnamed protein product [Aphanomyces euteiches]|uniref:WRKY transcription factor 19 n=1 Tax=Aphanomyces euteiches TaxID=100861 RepID=A0A6G0WF36_9STRA|nr:hypothetical protein Ae201684_015659 [Aphanomyces euteiches]KAH9094353.1 hypothetical protein Ae201684P_016962 [Aphanomyces euteiches]KAH9141448.1 hypothetical protein AeRB84_014390 [Aphanomyces euteiches]